MTTPDDGANNSDGNGNSDEVQFDEETAEEFEKKTEKVSEDLKAEIDRYGTGEISVFRPDMYGGRDVLGPGSFQDGQGDDIPVGDFDDAENLKKVYYEDMYMAWGDQAMRIKHAYDIALQAVKDIKDRYRETEDANDWRIQQIAAEADTDFREAARDTSWRTGDDPK
ncbi:hypothetical protein [Haloglycomyces albus]|uniref:hypothetical protein n=1 Tax=Haloglycomyces albus TaxID=526067 RepID=UPI00046D5B07|nr:hypothetical protein [Haloglycomyces albus]